MAVVGGIIIEQTCEGESMSIRNGQKLVTKRFFLTKWTLVQDIFTLFYNTTQNCFNI